MKIITPNFLTFPNIYLESHWSKKISHSTHMIIYDVIIECHSKMRNMIFAEYHDCAKLFAENCWGWCMEWIFASIVLLTSAFSVSWQCHKMLHSWFDPKKCWCQQKSGGLGKNNDKEEDYIGYTIIVSSLQKLQLILSPHAIFSPILWFLPKKRKCWKNNDVSTI